MKAQIIKQFGSANEFTLTHVPKLEPGPNEIMVQVKASSVNQIDIKIRQGQVPEISPALPATLGADIAGTVCAVGEGVRAFKVGDNVFGMIGGVKNTRGALAEFVTIDSALVAHLPNHLSFAEAAAMALVGLTAYEALFTKIPTITAGQKVLIHGGLGGVGHIALQLLRHTGATLYTTIADDSGQQQALTLGANYTINYKQQQVNSYVNQHTKGAGFDVIFDTVGGPNLQNSLQAAAIGGVIVTTAARTTLDLSLLHNKALSLHAVFILQPLIDGNHTKLKNLLAGLCNKIHENCISPLLADQQFSFEDIACAHRYLESGMTKGKVVVTY